MPRRFSRSPRPLPLLVLALFALALPVAGCGAEGVPAGVEAPVESDEPLPELPRGWSEHVNHSAGLTVGVPPGWSADNNGIRTELLSPDELVAATIVADRSDEALEFPLDQFAEAAITGLGGIEQLEPGDARSFEHRYDAVAVEATGVGGKKQIRQKILLVVVRRESLATFTVLVARNAEQNTRRYDGDVETLIRSLRSRTPG